MSNKEARRAKLEAIDAYTIHYKAKRQEAKASIKVEKQIVSIKHKRGDDDLDYEDSRLMELTYARCSELEKRVNEVRRRRGRWGFDE